MSIVRKLNYLQGSQDCSAHIEVIDGRRSLFVVVQKYKLHVVEYEEKLKSINTGSSGGQHTISEYGLIVGGFLAGIIVLLLH